MLIKDIANKHQGTLLQDIAQNIDLTFKQKTTFEFNIENEKIAKISILFKIEIKIVWELFYSSREKTKSEKEQKQIVSFPPTIFFQ